MGRPKSMFRYLEKYVGTYRVLAPYDAATEDFPRDEHEKLDDSFDDLYIPCRRGVIKHTYDPGILCWYGDSLGVSRNVYKDIKEAYPNIDITKEEIGSFDVYIYFKEEDLGKVAQIVQPRTNGARIKPYSDKNLPKPAYKIPEEDENKLRALTGDMESSAKMHFMMEVCKDFDEVISSKKGKRYNIKEERKKSKLKPKAFIHSIGMWEDFLEYVKTKL